MRFLFFITFIILLTSCTTNNSGGVYWCGDHPCINKKEREAYFKKNMIVEKRNLKEEKLKNKDDLEKIIEQAKINEKQRLLGEKELIKESKLNEKRKLKEQKRKLKEAKRQEKQLLKDEKELAKKIKKDEKKKLKKVDNIKSNEDNKVLNVDLGIATAKVDISDFKRIKDKIYNRNANKSFPDINKIPD